VDYERDDEDEPGDYATMHARFLHRLDQQLSDLRLAYESFSPEERTRLRHVLEIARAADDELADLGIRLIAHVEHEECDDDGNPVRWAGCEFGVCGMLLAIRSWDAGKHFTPKSFLP